ncbi:MAG: KamA family radical SAM protein [Candidatus Shapirobacteria bacterium]|nr:KamA family radical SAM protein [Candidatus Shapirobacteria bacterium]MDD3002295.1 KamA family radical SAM protein [Candidatus Shapirobacteria bacterium]MDD4382700.1 KamA family radical SAM protein [Candidatus Shapirobacteria bacterium]
MTNFLNDPLMEEQFAKIKGLIYKYPKRVLVELNNICPIYCEFCTRKRKTFLKKKWQLNKKELKDILIFLGENKEIREVVISGGDPLMSPKELIFLLKKMERLENIKVIRIHTRMPITAPEKISNDIFDFLNDCKKNIYLSIHCNLAQEISDESVEVLKRFRRAGVILYSQSVFLKGINDSVEELEKLFEKLLELGVRPYYIYRCDPVIGAEKFVVPFEKEKEIMTELRKRISGLAYPTYVIDAPMGCGKIPVPLNFWKNDKSFFDFNNKLIEIGE